MRTTGKRGWPGSSPEAETPTLGRGEEDARQQAPVHGIHGPRQRAGYVRQHLPRVRRKAMHTGAARVQPTLQLRRQRHL